MEFEKIQKIIADVLNIEPEKITMESAFVDDLNADSLDVLQIVMGIEDEFDIKIPDEATEKIVTVADAVNEIKSAVKYCERAVLYDSPIFFSHKGRMEINVKNNSDLKEFQNRIGYHFNDEKYLKTALTHSSFANEVKMRKVNDNERLEFLGDAVLELTSSDYIYKNHSEMNEGSMTRLRASIVCEPTLALCARAFGLDEFIMLGKGEELTGGRKRDSIVSDACEAVIGAIYLDGGFASAKEFITKFILNDLDNKKLFYDSKTILQEVVQANGIEVKYEMIGEKGPEHDKIFEVCASAGDLFNVKAEGHTKKAAQQKAAYNALILLKEQGVDINPKGKR